MNKKGLMAILIISVIMTIIMSYKAGDNYNKGRKDGYKAFCDIHEATMDSLRSEYHKAIDTYNAATYWCNKVQYLYEEKLDSINNIYQEK